MSKEKLYHDAFAFQILNKYLPLIEIYGIDFDENENCVFIKKGLANINLIRSVSYNTENKYMYLGEEYQLVELDESCNLYTRRALFVKANDIKRRFEITELK